MTKPTKCMCAQRRLRSAWASAQSDQESSLSAWRKIWVLSYPLCAKQRIWSEWADAQADLSLRWAYIYFVGFVMRWRIYLCILDESTVANRDARQNPKYRMANSWDESGSILFAKFSVAIPVHLLYFLSALVCSGQPDKSVVQGITVFQFFGTLFSEYSRDFIHRVDFSPFLQGDSF